MEVRLFAAGVLAELDERIDDAIRTVVASLASGSDSEALLAVMVVPSFHPKAAEPLVVPLISTLLHSDVSVRHHAKLALAHLGAVAAPALIGAIAQADTDLRRRIAVNLGEMREHYAALSEQQEPLTSELEERRKGIARELPAIIRCLIALAKDEDDSVKARAVHALGFGSLSRIPGEVQKEYINALEEFDDIAFRDVVDAAL